MEKIILDAIADEKALMKREAAAIEAGEAALRADAGGEGVVGAGKQAPPAAETDNSNLPPLLCRDCGDAFEEGCDRTSKNALLCTHGLPQHPRCLQEGSDGEMYCQTHHGGWSVVADAVGTLDLSHQITSFHTYLPELHHILYIQIPSPTTTNHIHTATSDRFFLFS